VPKRVRAPSLTRLDVSDKVASRESACLGMQAKLGGKLHLKLNIGERPIANKYCEGKMERTLKRE
jgi:hypothetical protein